MFFLFVILRSLIFSIFFKGLKMLFTRRKKAFCVLEFATTPRAFILCTIYLISIALIMYFLWYLYLKRYNFLLDTLYLKFLLFTYNLYCMRKFSITNLVRIFQAWKFLSTSGEILPVWIDVKTTRSKNSTTGSLGSVETVEDCAAEDTREKGLCQDHVLDRRRVSDSHP